MMSTYPGFPGRSPIFLNGTLLLGGFKTVNMDENTFSPNSSIDTSIKKILKYFDIDSQRRMKKVILDAKKAAEKHQNENTDAAARHKFREFIPAYILNREGFAFEYEKPIHGKTPDWLDDTNKLMLESYTYERGGTSSLVDRAISAVNNKYNKYKKILAADSLQLIISVYLDFLSVMSLDECRGYSEEFRTLLKDNDLLKLIVFFTETRVVDGVPYYGLYCLSEKYEEYFEYDV